MGKSDMDEKQQRENPLRIIFAPAIMLMDRLRYPQKMAVVALVFSIPLLSFMYLLISEINSDTAIARREYTGAIYEQALMRFVRDVQQHRGMTNAYLNGDVSFGVKLSEKQSHINNDIRAVYALDKKYGSVIPMIDEWNALKEKWDDLSQQATGLGAEESFSRHTAIIDDTLSLMVRVAYVSNLIFVPDMESFYLMDTMVNRLPLSAEYTGQIRGIGAGEIGAGKLSTGNSARLIVLAGQSRHTLGTIRGNLQQAFKMNPALEPAIGPYLNNAYSSMNEALGVLEKEVIGVLDIHIGPSEFFDIFTRADNAILKLHEAVTSALNSSLQARIDSLARKRGIIIAFAALTFLIIVYLFAGIYLSVTDSLSRLAKASGQIGSGDTGVTVALNTKDEMQQVAESFNNMSMKLARVMDELKRSNTELQHFAYEASHDLKSPLLAIGTDLKLFQRRYKGKLDAEADKFISDAIDSTIRMEKLISGILAYSRVGTHGRPLEPTDCGKALAESLANLKIAIEGNGALITHDPLPGVMADSIQLVQLFQNLIANAIKFRGEDPPHIHLSAVRKGREWVFSSSDNGIGIAPEHIDKIFEIFQRLHKQKYPGAGIGLATCKKIVERHGGRIWVESEPGRGSTFYFTIPVMEEGD